MVEWKSPIDPKIHFIWIGTNPYPDYFTRFLKGFSDLCPEFTIKVWSNKDLTKKNFPITYPYIQKIKKLQDKPIKEWTNAKTMYKSNLEPHRYSKWAQITDLMRLEIIYRHSGYYFDTTFQLLKPLYNLLNIPNIKFVGCNEFPRFKDVDVLSNSFFGATKGNPILKRLLSTKKLNKIDIRSSVVSVETGPQYLRSGINLSDNYKIFPTKYFYPFTEKLSKNQEPPYRKSSKDKCHSNKKTKRNTIRLKNKKGYLSIPCKQYPKSYAVKHWGLGKSWLISHYYNIENSHVNKKKVGQTGGGACIPCAMALPPPISIPIIAVSTAATCTKKGRSTMRNIYKSCKKKVFNIKNSFKKSKRKKKK